MTTRTTDASIGNDTSDADPHAAGASSTSDPSTDRHAAGKAVAQPGPPHSTPIKPGGAMIPPRSQDRRPAGCTAAPIDTRTPKATGNRSLCPEGTADKQGSTSAEAVKRGHQVAMIEVPDEDDDTAYQWWLTKGSPIVTPTQPVTTLPMASRLSDPNRTNVH